jgi:hypothetical protein
VPSDMHITDDRIYIDSLTIFLRSASGIGIIDEIIIQLEELGRIQEFDFFGRFNFTCHIVLLEVFK